MPFVATIDSDPPQARDFATAPAAEGWARSNANGAAWVVGELAPGKAPRLVASGLPDASAVTNDERGTHGQ